MPQDVEIGAGYCGDALFQRFPGQYRNPEMDQAERQHFNAFPGNHGPAYTDPDSGRKLVLKEMPGIGQVVVPADHAMASVVPVEHTMASIYPADQDMAGLGDTDPNTSHGHMHWHAKLVCALDASANMASAPAQLSTAFNTVAQCAVQCALEKAQKGRFKTADDAVSFVKRAITVSAKAFKPMVQKVAAMVAESTAKTVSSELKKAWCPPKNGAKQGKFRQIPSKLADWPGSMMGMGGLQASIANLTAGGDLDQLARSISKLNDALVGAYGQVTDLKAQEAAAAVNAPKQDGPPLATDEQYVQYLSAMKSVTQGYKALTGFDYMTQVISNAMTPSAAKLEDVYSGITGILGQMKNWNDTWQNQIGNAHPEMVQFWDQIQQEHNRLWAQAKRGAFDFDDPTYLQTAQQAVENLAGISPDAAGMSGMGDFGVTALIGVIIVAVAAVAITIAVVKLAGQFNAVANNIAKQRSEYEAQKDQERQDYIAKRTGEGVSIDVATQEWQVLKAGYDKAEAEKEKTYAKDTPSAGDLGKYIGYGAAAVGVVIALPHLMKLLGL
jgi:hypothetical protein